MIKAIALDLDGTLFSEDHKTVSEKNLQALRAASLRGVKIILASGRTSCLLEEAVKTVGVVDYMIVSNGAGAADKNGKTVFYDYMGYDDWIGIYRLLHKDGVVTEVYREGKCYLNKNEADRYKNPFVGDELIEEVKSALILCDDVEKVLYKKGAEKLHSIYLTDDKYSYYKNKLENEGYAVTSSIIGNMEVNKKGVNKGAALKGLCDSLGIKANEIMAFGDGENDVEMLGFAGYGFAMANGVEAAKKAAAYMAKSNIDDGVAAAVEEFVLK